VKIQNIPSLQPRLKDSINIKDTRQATMSELKGIHQDRFQKRFSIPGGNISRRELFKLASPLGKVALDSSKCTGCGLCAGDCPTGALVVLSDGNADTYQLLFKHNLCLACGQCVELCPEQCLALERTLEVEKLNSPAIVLFEDEIVRCSGCGSPVASRAMMDKIRAKVPSGEQLSSSRLELCPTCKIRRWR
jgi:ferredoxin